MIKASKSFPQNFFTKEPNTAMDAEMHMVMLPESKKNQPSGNQSFFFRSGN